MQTVGNTTNNMAFPLTWTDILLKSISGKTNYTLDVKIGTKRITEDNQDLIENPKKRRKQSNPTRISSNEKNMNHEFSSIESLSSDKNKNELIHMEPEENLILSSYNQCLSSLPLNLTKSENQNGSSSELQKMHVSNIIEQKELSGEAQQNLSSSHQSFTKVMSHLQNKDNNFNSTEPSSSNPSHISAMKAGFSPIQIFNPEAYCDQCNKEFCNKYFLKTHKANRHGVVIDNQPNNSILDQSDYRNNILPIFPMTSDFSSNIYDISTASTSSFFKSPPQYSLPLANTNAFVSKNMFNNQTRAFCNICHKEFCNKYFVRRHKAKTHGINDDSDNRTTVDDIPFNLKTNLQTKNKILDISVPDTCVKDKTISLLCDAHESMSEVNTQSKIVVQDTLKSVDNVKPIIKPVLVKTPCSDINEEYSDDEQNLNYMNTLPDEYSNANNNYNSRELDVDSMPKVNTNDELPIFQREYYRPNVQNIKQQFTEFKSGTGVPNLTINNRERDVLINNNAGKIIKQFNYSNNHTNVDENEKGNEKNNETSEIQNIELPSKTKLVKFDNLCSKLNGCTLGNMSQCYICNTHVNGSLKMHIIDKHENFVCELMNESSEYNGSLRTEYSCHECQKTFDSDASLKAHVEQCECGVKDASRASTTSSKNSAENDEYVKCSKDSGDRRPPSTLLLSSYCRICNKELCNKYFMKTHMQRMHGISIENGNNIGGVVCDVCNKELCSKYFLRVHKQNSHGIVESETGQKFWSDPTVESGPQSDGAENRYHKHYTEVCVICLRRFRSSKWLSAHLFNDHGDEGRIQWQHVQNHLREDEKQNSHADGEANAANGDPKRNPTERISEHLKQYRCSYCPFATSVLSFLFVHEKFHLAENNAAAAVAADEARAVCGVQLKNGAQSENRFCRSKENSENPPVAHRAAGVPLADANGNDAFAAKLGSSTEPRGAGDGPSSAAGNARRVPPESNREPFIMQSFFLENCSASSSKRTESSGRSDTFHSSLVYLPVKEKLTSTVNVSFKLTPA